MEYGKANKSSKPGDWLNDRMPQDPKRIPVPKMNPLPKESEGNEEKNRMTNGEKLLCTILFLFVSGILALAGVAIYRYS